MSGPTGYEPGGARTLIKLATYTLESVPPGDYPTSGNVFSETRLDAAVLPSDSTAEPFAEIVTDQSTGESFVLIKPSWGAPGTLYPGPF